MHTIDRYRQLSAGRSRNREKQTHEFLNKAGNLSETVLWTHSVSLTVCLKVAAAICVRTGGQFIQFLVRKHLEIGTLKSAVFFLVFKRPTTFSFLKREVDLPTRVPMRARDSSNRSLWSSTLSGTFCGNVVAAEPNTFLAAAPTLFKSTKTKALSQPTSFGRGSEERFSSRRLSRQI